MKQIKKILCGVMLTSFVILGSVSVFAGLGDEGTGGGGGEPDCEHQQIIEAESTVENSHYTEEVVVGDINGSAGQDFNFDPPPEPQPVPPGEEPPQFT